MLLPAPQTPPQRLHQTALLSSALLWLLLSSSLMGCGSMSGTVLNASGRGYYDAGQYAAARAEFARAATADPMNPHYAYNLARAMQAEGHSRAAEHQFRRAIALDPRHQPAYHDLAGLLTQQGRGDEAMQIVGNWSGSQPFVAESHVEMAALLNRMGDYSGAETSLQQALAVRPGHPQALAELGDVYQKTGRPQEAVAAYSQSLRANPSQSDLQSRIASLTTPASSFPTTGAYGPAAQPQQIPSTPQQSLAMLGGRPAPVRPAGYVTPRLPRGTMAPTPAPMPTQLVVRSPAPATSPATSMAGLPLVQVPATRAAARPVAPRVARSPFNPYARTPHARRPRTTAVPAMVMAPGVLSYHPSNLPSHVAANARQPVLPTPAMRPAAAQQPMQRMPTYAGTPRHIAVPVGPGQYEPSPVQYAPRPVAAAATPRVAAPLQWQPVAPNGVMPAGYAAGATPQPRPLPQAQTIAPLPTASLGQAQAMPAQFRPLPAVRSIPTTTSAVVPAAWQPRSAAAPSAQGIQQTSYERPTNQTGATRTPTTPLPPSGVAPAAPPTWQASNWETRPQQPAAVPTVSAF